MNHNLCLTWSENLQGFAFQHDLFKSLTYNTKFKNKHG